MRTTQYLPPSPPHAGLPSMDGCKALRNTTGRLLWLCMLASCLLLGRPSLEAQSPVAYWTFDQGNFRANAMSADYNISYGPAIMPASAWQGVRGNYLDLNAGIVGMGLADTSDNTVHRFDNAFSYETCFRADKAFASGYLFDWQSLKFRLFMSDRLVYAQFRQANGQVRQFDVPLYGVGRADPHYWQDGNWHHLVVSYDAAIGEVKLYLDGICPPGFSISYGPLGPLADGSYLLINNLSPSNQTDLSVDEIAIYDTVVPAWMAWQHAQEALVLHQAYTFLPLPNLPPPVYGPVQSGGVDPFEFAPGYPAAPLHSAGLLAQYPAPRVYPATRLPRNNPWIADIAVLELFKADPGSGAVLSGVGDISGELARNWHYNMLLGVASDAQNLNQFTDPNFYPYWLTHAANVAGDDTLPRFVISNWNAAATARVGLPPLLPIPHYYNQSYDTSFYLQAGAYNSPHLWSTDVINQPAKRALIVQDGDVTEEYYRRMVSFQTLKHIDVLGENGEEIAGVPSGALAADPDVVADRNSLGNNATWPGYQALRRTQFRDTYIGEGRSYLDGVNLGNGRDSCKVYWYDVGGTNGFKYDSMRTINSSIRGHRRASSYFYPQASRYWRYGPGGAITSMFHMFRARALEMAAGDSLSNPALSPGFSDGNAYQIADDEQIRPGQWLGLLKYLAVIGTDSYTPFEYNGWYGNTPEVYKFPGAWRIWKMSTPGYAQAVSSRVDDLVEHGAPLEGVTVFQFAPTGQVPTRWEFSAGGLNNLIGMRRIRNADRFLISGAIQRNSNFVGQAPKAKMVCIPFDPNGPQGDSLQFEIRAQGSSYVLDLTGADTVFYQLDAWHEWTDPCWWCRDFCIEGELPDTTVVAPQTIATWLPPGAARGDFRDFYAYLDWAGTTGGTRYDFVTRLAEQDTLHLWLRGWGQSGPVQVAVMLDGTSVGTIAVPGGVLGWAGQLQLTGLGIAQHRLHLRPLSPGLKLEKVALMRSDQPFFAQALVAGFVADTVCFGEPTHFTFTGAVPDGCSEMAWHFGDGTTGHGLAPMHQYAYPGRYGVLLTVSQPCSERVDSIMDSVWVSAPQVDAGEDVVTCGGTALQLDGDADYFFKWEEASQVSSPIVLDPTVQPAHTQWFHLTAIDPQTGCGLTDSVRVTVVEVTATAVNAWACDGDSATLGVGGGYFAWWAPDPLLSSDSVRNPRVLAMGDTVTFTAFVTDYLRCDTDTVVATLYSFGAGNPILAYAGNDPICDGDTTVLHVSGLLQPVWQPGAWIDHYQSFTPRVWPPEYTTPNADTASTTTYTVSGIGCMGQPLSLQVPVNVVESPAPNAWQDTLWQCAGGPVTLPGLVTPIFYPYPPAAASYFWQPQGQVSNPFIAQPTVSVAVPTRFTLKVGSYAGCDALQSLVVVPVGIAGADTVLQCAGDSVQLAASLDGGLAADSVHWHPAGYFADATALHATLSVPATTRVWAELWHGGCMVVDTVLVTVRTAPVVPGPDTLHVCVGDTVALLATGASPVLWNPGWLLIDSTSNAPTLVAAQSQTFIVASCDAFFCRGFDSVRVEVDAGAPLVAILTPDTLVCAGSGLLLAATPGFTYAWTPIAGMANATTATPTFTPAGPGVTAVALTGSDGGACLSHDTVTVRAVNCCTVPGVARFVRPRTANPPFSLVPPNGGAVHVVDTLFVNSPSVTFTNKTFYMDSAAVVYIQPGCTLNVVGCTFRSACGEMWADIGLPTSNARLVATNGTVRDALRGVWSRNGGAFAIDGTTFRNNYIGLQVQDYNGPAHPGSVQGARFLAGPLLPLPPGYPSFYPTGWAGIVVREVQNLTIGFPDLSVATENLFSGMAMGINAFHSRINVYHNRFVNIVPPSIVIGVGLYCGVGATGDMVFPANHGLTVGHPTSTNGPLLARHANTFTNCHTAVFVNQAMAVNVRGNTVASSTQYGVFVKSLRANALRIERNTLTGCGVAVSVGNSTQVDGVVGLNTVTNTGNAQGIGGIRLDNLQWGNLPPGAYPLQVRDNTVDVHGNGIFLNANHGVSVENNTVRLRRVNAQETLYGIFVGSNTRVRVANNPDIYSSGTGATNVRTAGIYVSRSKENLVLCNGVRDIARSVVFVGDCRPTDFLGNTMRNGVDGFVMLDSARIGDQGRVAQVVPPFLPAKPCGNVWQGTFTNSWTNALGGSIGDNSRFFVRSVPNQNPLPGVNQPVGNNNAKMHPTNVGNGNVSPVNCSSTLPGNGTGGAIQNVALNRKNGDARVQAAQFRADEWAYTALDKDPALMQGSPVIQSYHASCTGTSLAATCNANEDLVAADSVLSIAAASQIMPLSQSEVNHKAVLDIRLDDANLDSLEIQQLLAIAIQCEELGGKGVNIARGLLASEGILIWDDPGCQGALKVDEAVQDGSGDSKTILAECWPNPTSNLISVRFNLANVKGRLSLYDAQGKLLASEGFAYDGQPLEVETGRWSQGLVVVKVDLQDGTQFKWRVVVQR